MKTFLIKVHNKMVDVVEALNHKQAILDHATENKINPFFIKAEEIKKPGVKELFIKKAIKEYMDAKYPLHTDLDVQGSISQVVNDRELWEKMENLFQSHVDMYMGA